MSAARRRPRAAFIVRHINHYREDFYGQLVAVMSESGIDLDIVHGRPTPRDVSKQDEGSVHGSTLVENRVVYVRGQELVYQPVLRLAAGYDLVIVEQASRLLVNYLLVARRAIRRSPAVAFIGHGENVARQASGAGERVKRALTAQADWFFAYTEGTRTRLIDQGFPDDRITVFQNTIDTSGLRASIDAVTPPRRATIRDDFGVSPGGTLILVLGSLYPDKRPLDAVQVVCELREHGSDATLLFVGSGELESDVRDAVDSHGWIHHVSAAHGSAKADLLAASDLMLIPGVAGLVVLDAFAAGLPLVTIDNPHHPPEIAYVEDDRNGVVLPANASTSEVATATKRLIDDSEYRRSIANEARATGELLTLDAMVDKFATGLISAIQRTRHSS